MGKKQKLLQHLADGMDLPTEPLPGIPVLEVWGDGRVLIENHFGIVHYSREQILVKLAYGQVRICGCGMELTLMTKERLIITGRIDGLTLIRRANA